MLDLTRHRLLAQSGQAVADFLLPPRCAGCGARILEHGHLCGACWPQLEMIAAPHCQTCGLPFEVDAGADAQCGRCMQEAPGYDWARAAVSYGGMGRDLVLKLKHGGVGSVVPVLVSMMAFAVPKDKKFDLIVPVPLHRWRLLRRRYNQSQLLASGLGRRLGVSVDPFVLKRLKQTPSQGTLDRKNRKKNVQGAFRVDDKRGCELSGKSVLLVDDVLTTGATVSSCAQALKKAGVREVGVSVFARVGQPHSG